MSSLNNKMVVEIFTNNIILCGFCTKSYEIQSLLILLGASNLISTSNVDVLVFLDESAFVEKLVDTYYVKLYNELKSRYNFLFGITVCLFLSKLEQLTLNTFVYIMGHGDPCIGDPCIASAINIGDAKLDGKQLIDAFNKTKRDFYLCLSYSSCYNYKMFTQDTIPKGIISFQHSVNQSIVGNSIDIEIVKRDFLLQWYESLAQMRYYCKHTANKSLLYNKTEPVFEILFTLFY